MPIVQLELTPNPLDPTQVLVSFAGAGEARGPSTLPYPIERLPTILKILDSVRGFQAHDFPDPSAREWMEREGLLADGHQTFHYDLYRRIGKKLFATLVPPHSEIEDALITAFARAMEAEQSLHLRICLRAQDRDLAAYPWELACDEFGFLAHGRVQFSRYISFGTLPPSRSVAGRLNVAIIASAIGDPRVNLPPFDPQEHDALKRALASAVTADQIELRSLRPTWSSLQAHLNEQRGSAAPHIIHFDGHGYFGRRCNGMQAGRACRAMNIAVARHCAACGAELAEPQGYLLFAGDTGEPDYVSAIDFAALLQLARGNDPNGPVASLVVLSACRSGLALYGGTVFNGLAQRLIAHRVPAVVAMQYNVTLEAAATFVEQFYRALGSGDTLVRAVSWGRHAMGYEGNQWYRPVLYLRYRIDSEDEHFLAAATPGDSQRLEPGQPLPSAIRQRPDYVRYTSSLIDYYTEVFVGREQTIARVVAFPTQRANHCLRIEAPVGYGKSALVAELMRRYLRGAWPAPRPTLIVYFVRLYDEQHTPAAFLTAVNAQLLDQLALDNVLPASFEELYAQFRQLWEKAVGRATPDRPLILLVDGLDDAAFEATSAFGRSGGTIIDLLPAYFGSDAYLIVTMRRQDWLLQRRPQEHPLRRADVLTLTALSRVEIEALLHATGVPAELVVGLAPRVRTLTAGEPLYVRFVCRDIARDGADLLVSLERSAPKDIEEYFRQQFEQLKATAQTASAWDLLGLIVVAHGGLTADDLAEILELPKHRLISQSDPLRPFLLDHERFELMHPVFQKMITGLFSPRELAAFRRRLVAWGRIYQVQGWPESTPPAVVKNFARNLVETANGVMLHELLQEQTPQGLPCWAVVCERSGLMDRFLDDVALAWSVADGTANDLAVALQLRYALISASFNSVATTLTPEELAHRVARTGWALPAALAYALRQPLDQQRIEACIALGPYLTASLARRAYEGLRSSVADRSDLAIGLARLSASVAPELRADLAAEALDIVAEIRSRPRQKATLLKVAPMIRAEEAQHILAITAGLGEKRLTERIGKLLASGATRAEAVPHESGHAASPVSQVDQDDLLGQISLLTAFARLDPSPDISPILALARQLKNDAQRLPCLVNLLLADQGALHAALLVEIQDVAARLARGGQFDQILGMAAQGVAAKDGQLALELAALFGADQGKAVVLLDLARLLPASLAAQAVGQALPLHIAAAADYGPDYCEQQARTLAALGYPREALELAAATGDVLDRGYLLASVAALLPSDHHGLALEFALQLDDALIRVVTLSRLAVLLDDPQRATALQAALASYGLIEDPSERDDAAAALALTLGTLGESATALQLATNIDDTRTRLSATSQLAAHLPLDALVRLAREVAQLPPEPAKVTIVTRIAQGLVVAGRSADGFAVLGMLTDLSAQAEAFCQLALARDATPATVSLALDHLRAIMAPEAKLIPLAQIIAHPHVALHPDNVSELLVIAEAIAHLPTRIRLLMSVATILPEAQRGPVLEALLALVQHMRNASNHVAVMIELVALLAANGRGQEALTLARSIRDPRARARALLEVGTDPELIWEGTRLWSLLAAVRRVDSPLDQRDLLTAMLTRLPAPAPEELLIGVLNYILAIRRPSVRSAGLASLAPLLEGLEQATLAHCWAKALHLLSACPRHEMLADLQALSPLLRRLTSSKGRASCVSAVIDVGRWFGARESH